MSLPPPDCPWGYPHQQVRNILGTFPEYRAFALWMNGQTQSVCDGREYDHDAGEYKPTACAEKPHGMVVYPWDLERYMRQTEDENDPSN